MGVELGGTPVVGIELGPDVGPTPAIGIVLGFSLGKRLVKMEGTPLGDALPVGEALGMITPSSDGDGLVGWLGTAVGFVEELGVGRELSAPPGDVVRSAVGLTLDMPLGTLLPLCDAIGEGWLLDDRPELELGKNDGTALGSALLFGPLLENELGAALPGRTLSSREGSKFGD